jgi:hypothetical protein
MGFVFDTGGVMRDTIDMAREAGFPLAWISDSDGGVIRWKDIKAFEALVRADEREECAKVIEAIPLFAVGEMREFEIATLSDAAKQIRARGNT